MPGDNCSIKICGTTRKTKDFGIFQLPYTNPADPAHQSWRSECLNSITKDVLLTSILKSRSNL